jgi:hypothetical protein
MGESQSRSSRRGAVLGGDLVDDAAGRPHADAEGCGAAARRGAPAGVIDASPGVSSDAAARIVFERLIAFAEEIVDGLLKGPFWRSEP